MATQADENPGIKSCARAFNIIELIDDQEGATVNQISDQVDIAKSTAHYHVTTLEELGYLVKKGEKYHLGLKFLQHGMSAKKRVGLSEIAKSELERIAEKTGEVVKLAVEEHGKVVYLDVVEGRNAVKTYGTVGQSAPINANSVGKAILAYLPKWKVDEIINYHGMAALTEQTITDSGKLFDELEEIRQRGIAFNDEETLPGVRGVASPIVYEGEVYGSIGLGAPAKRLQGEKFREKIPNLVSGATNAIELTLRHESDW